MKRCRRRRGERMRWAGEAEGVGGDGGEVEGFIEIGGIIVGESRMGLEEEEAEVVEGEGITISVRRKCSMMV